MSGFGITEFRTVESITCGMLDKVDSFKIHTNLEIPFAILLALHVLFSPAIRMYAKFKAGRNALNDP